MLLRVSAIGFLVMMTCLSMPAAREEESVWRNERIAARQVTVVSINEGHGIPMMFTYAREPEYWLHNIALGKLRVGILNEDDSIAWLDEAKAIEVHNIPSGEGVYAQAEVSGHTLKIEVLPSEIGLETMEFEGGALFLVHCQPAARLVARYGALGRVGPISRILPGWPRREAYLSDPDLVPGNPSSQSCQVMETGGILESADIPLTVAAQFHSSAEIQVTSHHSQLQAITTVPTNSLKFFAAFSEEEDRAEELAAADPTQVETESRDHFRTLTASAYIKTPVSELDETFEASLFNLEYAWVRPYGWIEGPHHWGTFYSQQMNLAADWIGQQDRSREMLLTHARNLRQDGQVPQMDTSGRGRVDFGGWNQFYVWGVEHHWLQTADGEFLEAIWQPLNRVIDQTFSAHDPDGNGLLNFGQQIGNQEDYISTPRDGTSPTIAAIEMLRIRAELATPLGLDPQVSETSTQKARWMTHQLQDYLWMPELGRYAFYRDRHGVMRLDGQYHTMIWPTLYGLVSLTDGYMAMRHLEDVMTGDEGEIYVSRNFPHPVVATVGSQAGGQQQPWGTMGWAALGDGDRAIRSLEWMARQVMSPHMQGSWPEVNALDPNTDAVYFTPPAGVYIQAMIESVFGLKLDRPAGVLKIEPCLPSSWPEASLHLPEFEVQIQQAKGARTIDCRSTDSLRHLYRVAIDPATRVAARLNDKRVKPVIEPGVGCLYVTVDAGESRESSLELSWQPLDIAVAHPQTVARDGDFEIEYGDLAVNRILDPTGMLESVELDEGTAHLTVRENIAEDAELYGKRGEATLTRRTIFLEAETEGHPFWHPVDLVVAPPLHFTSQPVLEKQGQDWGIEFSVSQTDRRGRSLSAEQVSRTELAGREFAVAERDSTLWVPLAPEELYLLDPGLNKIVVHLRDGRSVEGRFDAFPVMNTSADIREFVSAQMHHVDLSNLRLSPDTQWPNWRPWFAFGHPPWSGVQPPLSGMESPAIFQPDCAPGLTFQNPDRQLAVVNYETDQPSLTIPVGIKGRKVYLLVMALVENHDVFSPISQIIVKTDGGKVYERTLHFPGDLDWFPPPTVVGGFATYGRGWNDNLAWQTPSSVLTLIELDLGDYQLVNMVTINTIGEYHGIALAGLTIQGTPPAERVQQIPPSARELMPPQERVLFSFDSADSLNRWTVEGDAWGITSCRDAAHHRCGTDPFFADSLAFGESATGVVTSPAFEITGSRLAFGANGHGEKNYYALIRQPGGELLRRHPAVEATGNFIDVGWDVTDLKGEKVRFQAVDASRDAAYSWIAFDNVRLIVP